MTGRVVLLLLMITVLAGVSPARAAPTIGGPAPAFGGHDTQGRAISLADFTGRTVVLEWTNHECPFVRKHYESGNMQRLQREAANQGAVWLTIVSSAPGKQGHVTAKEANALTASRGAAPAHVILDETGTIGRLYGAGATPTMVVIRPDQTIAYMGAIDSIPSARIEDIPKADNFVRDALAAVAAGEPVGTPLTKAYGCSVKYP
ncbi:MAG: redoxin domain-containing protein [Alphaproteobacteria bacterium]|nr:redoxin domain-containing protein [Alphaproteobacteria bacterium]